MYFICSSTSHVSCLGKGDLIENWKHKKRSDDFASGSLIPEPQMTDIPFLNKQDKSQAGSRRGKNTVSRNWGFRSFLVYIFKHFKKCFFKWGLNYILDFYLQHPGLEKKSACPGPKIYLSEFLRACPDLLAPID